MQALECVPLGIISLVAILFTVLIQHSVVGEGGGGVHCLMERNVDCVNYSHFQALTSD